MGRILRKSDLLRQKDIHIWKGRLVLSCGMATLKYLIYNFTFFQLIPLNTYFQIFIGSTSIDKKQNYLTYQLPTLPVLWWALFVIKNFNSTNLVLVLWYTDTYIHICCVVTIINGTITIKRLFIYVLLQLGCASKLPEDVAKIPIKIFSFIWLEWDLTSFQVLPKLLNLGPKLEKESSRHIFIYLSHQFRSYWIDHSLEINPL